MNVSAVGSDRADRLTSRHRSSWIAAAVAASLLLVLSLLPSAAAAPALAAADRPTVVLVHGAWAGPSGWDQVASLLGKDGYETAAPGLALASLSGDVATLTATLDAIAGPKVLVGHSYGAMVTSSAAAGRSDVRALVYTAGIVADEGETVFSVQEGYEETDAIHHLIFDPFPFAYIDPAFFPQIFAQDLSPKKAAELNAGQRAVSLVALTEPSGPVAWRALPSWFAISGRDLVVDPAAQQFMAERAGSNIVRFDDASHAGGYTHYANRLAKLIEEAATATAR